MPGCCGLPISPEAYKEKVMRTDSHEIMHELEQWVRLHGSGTFSDENYETVGNFGNFAIPEIPGIQQVRKEIEEFVQLLLALKLTRSMLEIGLGYYGSTHFLWRQFIGDVITIEKIHDRVREFGANTRKFYGKWVLGDNRSSFLIGSSNDVRTVQKAYTLLEGKPVDALFIDGDHSYEGVLTDWLLYSPLVRKGGLVAFHDALLHGPELGVADFLDKLKSGALDGTPRQLAFIVHSKETGIAYYVQS
jgi:predicted O-methyltransferase YrrM